MVQTPWKPATTGADHDAQRRRDFNAAAAGGLQALNFEPATGIGKFDAVYNVAQKQLQITVKARYDFVDGGSAKWGVGTDKEDFIRDSKRLVKDAWSRQYVLACSRPGWTDLFADVDFKIKSVQSGEHMPFRVMKINPGESAGGGLVGGTSPFLSLSNMVLGETRERKFKEQIFNFKRKQLEEAVQQHGAFVPFLPNSAELSSSAAAALLPVASAVQRIYEPGMDALRVYVFGSTGAADRTLQTGLGAKRGEAVANFLRAKAGERVAEAIKTVTSPTLHSWIPAELAKIASRAAGKISGKNFSGVCLMVHVPKAQAENQLFDSKYIVMLHEFGHVIGLPDEYFGVHDSGIASYAKLSSITPESVSRDVEKSVMARPAAQQAALGSAMKTAQAPSPIFVNNAATSLTTSSIMAAGRDILPAHYLTVWAALARMTSRWIDPAEWRIVPKTGGQMRNYTA